MTGTGVVAAGTAGGGLPLWAVCAIAFVAMLFIALYVLLSPLAKRDRLAKQARLDEVHRYRVLGVYGDEIFDVAAPTATESVFTTRALAAVDRAVRARGQRERLVLMLDRAGMRMRPEEWALIQLAVIVAAAALTAVIVGPLGLLAAAPAWLACRYYVSRRTSRRATRFVEQLPDALQLLAGAMRTGFGLNQAMGTVVREGIEPVSTEFGRALQEVRLGAELEDALADVAERMRSYDMALVVMAIRTAREVGGNLAEVLSTTVVTMRERVQLFGQVKVLTAEGRFSAKVLVGLPIMMAVYLVLFKPDYLRPLYTTGLGVAMIAGGGLLVVGGWFWLQRLTKIEV